MNAQHCYWDICFVHLQASDTKFFGFSEFLAALALMVLAWTIADTRYRFRIRTAPLPLQGGTYAVVGMVGVLTLLTDWWRAEQWFVPQWKVMTPAAWQAILAAAFLANFLTWAWFAFIRPPVFGRWNSRRFTRQLKISIITGAPAELPEIAAELEYSAKRLITSAWTVPELERQRAEYSRGHVQMRSRNDGIRQSAHEVLLLLGDRRFCRSVVQSAPSTAMALFEAMTSQKKYDVALGTFAKNVTSEAIASRESFAYHEVAGSQTGFIGYYKPLTTALYGNYSVVSALKQVFDVGYEETRQWKADQWKAFCRLVLVTFCDYIDARPTTDHPYVLFRAAGDISRAPAMLAKLNGAPQDSWADEELDKLSVVVDFVGSATGALNASVHRPTVPFRRKKADPRTDIHDLIVRVMVDTVLLASRVKHPRDLCWTVHYIGVWSELFEDRLNGPAGKIILYRVRRRLYDEVVRMATYPNFKSSAVLAMLLNVMGLSDSKSASDRSASPLHRAVLSWVKKHYVWLAEESPRVASDCLPEGIIYEPDGPRLIKTGLSVLDRAAPRTILDLLPYAKPTEPGQ